MVARADALTTAPDLAPPDGEVENQRGDPAFAPPGDEVENQRGDPDIASVGSGMGAAASAPVEARGLVGWWQVAELAAVILVGLGLALTLPLATSVFALLLFGVLHNYFELRYVVGRFGPLFNRRLFEVTLLGLTVIMVMRLLPLGGWGRPLEIVAVYGLLALTLVLRLGGRPWLLAAGLGIVVLALAASLAYVEHHFVVITHLHNVLPLVFLWEWLWRGASTPAVRAFRGLHLTWAVGLPLLLLAGLFDGLMGAVGAVAPALADWTPAAQIVGDVDSYVRAMTPPGSDTLLGVRLLSIFALLQLLHYYVWCRFFPAVGAVEVGRFNQTMQGLGLPRGHALTGLALLLAGLIFALMWADFQRGRSLYSALAGYHAYLEYTLLLLFVVSWRRT